MKLIVGLGNPGVEYKNTRHNIGFMFFDFLGIDSFTLNKKMNSYESFKKINGEKVIFVKPTTFMNLSGSTVKKYMDYYNMTLDDLLIIQDDLDMKIGNYKFSYNHNHGGHNGIKNIIECLDSKSFLRVKIGILNHSFLNDKDFVLGKFNKEELKIINNIFRELENIIEDFLVLSRDKLMGKYN